MLMHNFHVLEGFLIAFVFTNVHRQFFVSGSITDEDDVTDSICKKHVRRTGTRYVSYREVYVPNPWTRRRTTKWNYRTETYLLWEPMEVCCDGYEVDTDILDRIRCNPVCENGCPNGKCHKPNLCKCDLNYRQSINATTGQVSCEPICSSGCNGGRCASPGICECDDGYILSPHTESCEPSCDSVNPVGSNFCGDNASCVGPNECKCHEGYIAIVNSSLTIDNETSLSHVDDRPTNDTKWRTNVGSTFNTSGVICQPFCETQCPENSYCAGPNVCQCKSGYNYTLSMTNATCSPICDKECVNGYCGEPDKCYCQSGYMTTGFENDGDDCVPLCTKNCINGMCVMPERCECIGGYEKLSVQLGRDDDYFDNVCVPICSNNCSNGYCLAPDRCSCPLGYVGTWITSNETAMADVGVENDASVGSLGQRSCRPFCEPPCAIGKVCTDANECQRQSNLDRDFVLANDTINVNETNLCNENGVYDADNRSCCCFVGLFRTGPKCDEPLVCEMVPRNDRERYQNGRRYVAAAYHNGTERVTYITDGRLVWKTVRCRAKCLTTIWPSENSTNRVVTCHEIELYNQSLEFPNCSEYLQVEFFTTVDKTAVCFTSIAETGSWCNDEHDRSIPHSDRVVSGIARYFTLFVLVVGLGTVAIYFINRKIRRIMALRAVQRTNALREQAEAMESLYATDEGSQF